MGRACVVSAAIFFLVAEASAQPTDHPAFEAADVHVSPHKLNPGMTGGFVRAGRYEVRSATMLDLISNAYGVDAEKILGGPAWLDSDRFDITAKAAASTSNETAKLMLRSLLSDRFKLDVRNEERPVDVYVLTVVKGPAKMKQADAAGPAGSCQRQPQPPPAPGAAGVIAISCHNMTMDGFADGLRDVAGPGYIVNDVVNLTGLTGGWDFDLQWTPRGQLGLAGSEGAIFAAIERVGLKLDLVKRPLPVIVVASANQRPTDNRPDVAKVLPVAPSEFEVADIKPSAPGTTQRRGNFQPGGRLDLQGFTMRDLVALAWEVPDVMVAPAPKWMETDRFDIVARAPRDVVVTGPVIDVDTLRTMLRTLLADRFKLVTHTEEQPVQVYVLSLPRPQHKLKKGDPSVRSACRPATAGPDIKVLSLGIGRSCQNITLSQLAERLPSFAPGYIDRPVVDATGLEGGWDFTMAWTGRGALESARTPAGPQANGQPSTATPDGSMTLFEAVDKQLGLKLELQKRPMPVLVIDHAEQKPTEN
jgi:uncharacterized protein (TIGR03435 family)